MCLPSNFLFRNSFILIETAVEVDEAYFGGVEKHKHEDKKLNKGRGAVGKIAVVGVSSKKVATVLLQSSVRSETNYASVGSMTILRKETVAKYIDRITDSEYFEFLVIFGAKFPHFANQSVHIREKKMR